MQSSLTLRCFWNTTRALLSLSHKWEVLPFRKLFQQWPLHFLHHESSSKSPPPPKILHLLEALHLPIWVCNPLGGLGGGLASKIEKWESGTKMSRTRRRQTMKRWAECMSRTCIYMCTIFKPSSFTFQNAYVQYTDIHTPLPHPLIPSSVYKITIYMDSSSSICFVHRENGNQRQDEEDEPWINGG